MTPDIQPKLDRIKAALRDSSDPRDKALLTAIEALEKVDWRSPIAKQALTEIANSWPE